MEISSTALCRNADVYTPYGYQCAVPAGEEVLLIPSSGGYAAAGTKMPASSLAAGEIIISSSGNAYILFKKNGSVIINGLEINGNGEIVE